MSYELYAQTHAIANSIVKNSKGMGFNRMDAEQVKFDLDRAVIISDLAARYWETKTERCRTMDKLRAAKLLELDFSEYERECDTLSIMEDELVIEMKEIAKGFRKDYLGNWKEITD